MGSTITILDIPEYLVANKEYILPDRHFQCACYWYRFHFSKY